MNTIVVALVLYVIVGVGGNLFLLFSRNAELKRRFVPFYVTAGALTFIAVVAAMDFGWGSLLLTAGFVSVTAMFTYRNIRICDRCAKTAWGVPGFDDAPACTRCGAPLEGSVER